MSKASEAARYRDMLQGFSLPIDTSVHPCNCVGPQDGNPVCPCRMRFLTTKDGRWVEIIDHGPVAVSEEGSDQ